MEKLTPLLMFEGNAGEAMDFYISLFKDAKITAVSKYGKNEAGTEGSVQHATFCLNGQDFMCIDSHVKHGFSFTPSISIYTACSSNDEITTLFDQLSAGGQVLMPLGEYPFSKKFGWVADRFGVSWQLNLMA